MAQELEAITLSVCIVSHYNALPALLVSNNFSEIKSYVFKGYSKDNVHSMVYSEHLLVYLFEMAIDVIKHSFIAKFNISPIAYSEFLEVLCKQDDNLKFVPTYDEVVLHLVFAGTRAAIQKFKRVIEDQVDENADPSSGLPNNDRRIKKDIEHKVLQISNVVGPRLHSRGTISNDAAKKEEKLVETSKRKPHEGHQPHARGLKLRGTSDNDAAKMEEKLETSKRKLHEGYQAHERDRRSTRYFEGYECDLPKGKHSRRSSRPKLSNRRKYS
ncbi:hypothetical protein JHK87_007145 [Glycine soja]|nr:hypothetical protein JHK87_007145 [Glycine soja]KAG5072094.1 hypothetical protein JHK86_007305 [Glycine max]